MDNVLTDKQKSYLTTFLYMTVLLLSLGLIIFISIDTFEGINFLDNHYYMTYQLWVCVIFVIYFFVEYAISDDKWHYVKHRWFFLVLSIPYLNIINLFNIDFTHEELYFIRFIPLARGALALSLIIGYMTTNRISSLFLSYIVIMLSVIYFASLIFLEREQPVNNLVPNYGAALWWALMDATTIGSYIYPVTVTGKILAVVLAALGMMMFPLFTVYITNWLQRYNKRHNPTLFEDEFTDQRYKPDES